MSIPKGKPCYATNKEILMPSLAGMRLTISDPMLSISTPRSSSLSPPFFYLRVSLLIDLQCFRFHGMSCYSYANANRHGRGRG